MHIGVNAKYHGNNVHAKSTSKENLKAIDLRKFQISTTRTANIKREQEDELQTLNKLSYLNAGARYELLSINQQLLDFDLKFKVRQIVE